MFNLEKLKVLFVEDEEKIRINIQEAIGEEFALFETASDGLNGLQKYKDIKPDIIVTDIEMPHLNGLEMVARIRKISPDVPVIILSAFSEKEKLFQAIDSNVSKYIVKPIDIDELLEVISDLSNKFDYQHLIELSMGYTYDSLQKKLYLNDDFITLTKKEVLFIDILVENKESYAKNDDLYKKVWNDSCSGTTVRTFVQRLRNKTNKDFIENVSGLGYKISKR